VRLEVDNVIQDNGGKLNMRSLQNLSYLERCLKEALRLYPSVHLIERMPTDDVKLRNKSFFLLHISLNMLHNTKYMLSNVQ